MQLAHPTHFTQHRAAEFETVLDLGSGQHVVKDLLDLGVFGFDVEAANLVGLVFLGGHPARRRAGGAVLAQGEHAGALRAGREKRIGVDADHQVSLHVAGFLHAHMQGHKEVGIAGEVGTHGAAVEVGLVDAVAQAVRQAQHHVFFTRTPRPDGARVFTAVARIQRNDDEPVGGVFFAAARRRRHQGFRWSRRGGQSG